MVVSHLILLLLSAVHGWVHLHPRHISHAIRRDYFHPPDTLALRLSTEAFPENDEDDEVIDVGLMRVSEIKAELKLRGIDFSDCFDRESLAQKLRMARSRGRSDPSIIDRFNRQRVSDFKRNFFSLSFNMSVDSQTYIMDDIV
jgi:hypothetical protein